MIPLSFYMYLADAPVFSEGGIFPCHFYRTVSGDLRVSILCKGVNTIDVVPILQCQGPG